MANTLFCLVAVVIVAMAAGAPMSVEENLISASAGSSPGEGGQMRVVAKRAEEMVYFGNQQNAPRVPMKKSGDASLIHSLLKPPEPLGDVDEGGSMVAHEEMPVEEDLNARAEAVQGTPESERLEEATKIAMEEAEKSVSKADAEGEVSEVEGDSNNNNNNDNANIVNAVEDNNSNEANEASMSVPEESNEVNQGGVMDDEVDLPESEPALVSGSDSNENGGEKDSDEADIENIASSSMSSVSAENNDVNNDASGSADDDVEEFLEELRNESEEDKEDVAYDVKNAKVPDYKMVSEAGAVDPNFYQPMYHILANSYGRGPLDDYYNYKFMLPYIRRRRHSPLRRRDLALIRRRRSGHVRRMKRGLPSDWLGAYSDLDLPLTSEEVEDSLLADLEESYEYEPVNEELSRYIYGNLLNKLANSYGGLDADVEEEIPYEEILPYDTGSELSDSLADEYEPENLLYDTELPASYRESPYDDVIPSYDYRKRSGGSEYYPDSRRKRYFYPVYDEPETHWGAFVPEKRSYDDAIQRLQRLALALSDNPRPYYENLLREYKKK